jgi:hypothetical protein
LPTTTRDYTIFNVYTDDTSHCILINQAAIKKSSGPDKLQYKIVLMLLFGSILEYDEVYIV